jgi:hypothetical protein
MKDAVVHVHLRTDEEAFAFGDFARRQPGVTAVQLTTRGLNPQELEYAPPELTPEPRFLADPVFVSGNSPAELESEALAHVEMATGWTGGQLKVWTPYLIHEVPPAPGRRSAQAQAAAAQEHRLYAEIAVKAWDVLPALPAQEDKDA